MSEPKWLEFSEEINALDNLEKTYFFVQQTIQDKKAWKWVVLCVYSAMYGFAICALKGTNPDRGIIKTKKGDRLINFAEAIDRCQKPPCMKMTVISKHLQLNDEQKYSIKKISKEFRNKFVHYIPKSWKIEVSGMPAIIRDCLEVVRFLALDTGNYIHLTKNQQRKVKSLIHQSIKILNQQGIMR